MVEQIIILVIFFFSVIIHEISHGYIALLNGDDTAKIMGRLTLNPISHIDPFGTIILPLFLFLVHSPFIIGMAKPVPINPFNFRDQDKGMLTVGLAGPLSNILLGTIFALLVRFLSAGPGRDIFLFSAYINYILAFFNLIPIPPLDGSRVLAVFLPYNIRIRYESIERFGIFIVIIILFLFNIGNLLFTFTKIIVNPIAGF
ncbi:MAG TPA: site-2 protease family protein [Candidatus Ratteibacteria bacterium]|nr:site-2 protease family protein [Candidatus Ratteibacteria bacterium]